MNPHAEQASLVRNQTGVWLRDDYTFIRFTGADVAPWMQSQITNDVVQLETGQGCRAALLDRHGRLQAHFTVHRWEDEYWMLVEKQQTARLLEQLDAHLFIEDVTIEETGGEVDQVVIQGPRALGYLASLLDTEEGIASELLPQEAFGCHPIELLGREVLAFRVSLTGEDGYVFVLELGEGEGLLDALIKRAGEFTIGAVGPDAQETLRIEAGIPRYGVDMDDSNVISETTLERDAISFEKGCYLGQEVVARLKTYGSPKKALMGLQFDLGAQLPEPGSDIVADKKKIGRITSVASSPTLDAPIALAYLGRDHRVPDATIAFNTEHSNTEHTARVVVLPFYAPPDRADRALALYDEALTRFQEDLDDADASAIPLLKEAILLQPAFEDAYEVLGVILNRHQRVDEAIHYMKVLERLNPDCLMAHTNLSVFYVAKGMIDEAEQEKAKAAVLGIQKASNDRQAQDMAEAERRRIEEEAAERIAMFKEVLDIDPDDPVATYGLGKAHIQLHQYEEAVPYLFHATEVQKDYSAAYLDLGKCHEFLDHADDAIATYKEGIAIASRKGDLMPLREMERRLKILESTQSTA